MPSPRLHPFWRLLIFALGAIIISVLVSLVVGAALSTAAILNGQNPAELAETFFEQYALWLNLALYPPILVWLWFCRGALDRRSVASLGLRPHRSVSLFVAGGFCGAAAIAFLFGVLWLTRSIVINGPSPEAFEAGTSRTIGMLALHALLFCAVGFVEELLFRGYAWQNLAAMFSTRGAMWMQAVLFALIHLGNTSLSAMNATGGENQATAMQTAMNEAWRAMPGIALVGVFFALAYQKTGSLWFPIGFHAAWNFCLGCIFSLPVSGISLFRLWDVSPTGSTWITGGSFGAEGSLLLLPILVVMIWLLQRQPDHPQAQLDLALLRPDPQSLTAHIATQKQELPINAPLSEAPRPAIDAIDATDVEPHIPRYQTSMRPREAEDTPVILWGQLPNEGSGRVEPVEVWQPTTSAVPIAASTSSALPVESSAAAQSTLMTPEMPAVAASSSSGSAGYSGSASTLEPASTADVSSSQDVSASEVPAAVAPTLPVNQESKPIASPAPSSNSQTPTRKPPSPRW
jgi:membrane protease YdiL (CAAX protease family)